MKRTLICLATIVIAGACIEGGANTNGNGPGNKPGGVAVGIGEIAVDPGGRWIFSESNGQLLIGDIHTRVMRAVPDIGSPWAVAFWSKDQGAGIYAIADADGMRETIVSYDLDRSRIVWRRALDRADTSIDVSPAGDRLIVRHVWNDLLVLDARTGDSIFEKTFEHGIADLDITADGKNLIVTTFDTRDENQLPTTEIDVLRMNAGEEVCSVSVPNCSSDLVLSQDQTHGFLAPTRCGRDPVSVIDFSSDQCAFKGNLPGFGPIALSPDGATAVAFIDRDSQDLTAPPLPEAVRTSWSRYHLMFLDTETLDYATSPLGDALPRYAFTPDGMSLLVDTDDDMHRTNAIIILDIEDKTARTVRGDDASLDQFVLTPDGEHAFIVDSGLFDLQIHTAEMTRISLGFRPTSINMMPDGKVLLLKSAFDGLVHLFDVGGRSIIGEMSVDHAG